MLVVTYCLSLLSLPLFSSAFDLFVPPNLKPGSSIDIDWQPSGSAFDFASPFSLRLTLDGKPTGIQVDVDDLDVKNGQISLNLPLEGGNYVLEAVRQGRTIFSRPITIPQGPQSRPPPPPFVTPPVKPPQKPEASDPNPPPPPPTPQTSTATSELPRQSDPVDLDDSEDDEERPPPESAPESSSTTASRASQTVTSGLGDDGPAADVKAFMVTTLRSTSTDPSGSSTLIEITSTVTIAKAPTTSSRSRPTGGTPAGYASKSRTPIIVAAVLGSILFLVLLLILFVCYRRRQRQGRTARFEQDLISRQHWERDAEKASIQSSRFTSLASRSFHDRRNSTPLSHTSASTAFTHDWRESPEPKSIQSSSPSLSSFAATVPEHQPDVQAKIIDLERQRRVLDSQQPDSPMVKAIEGQIAVLKSLR